MFILKIWLKRVQNISMNKNLEIKTYDGWKDGSIYNYLVVGNIVDKKK